MKLAGNFKEKSAKLKDVKTPLDLVFDPCAAAEWEMKNKFLNIDPVGRK